MQRNLGNKKRKRFSKLGRKKKNKNGRLSTTGSLETGLLFEVSSKEAANKI